MTSASDSNIIVLNSIFKIENGNVPFIFSKCFFECFQLQYDHSIVILSLVIVIAKSTKISKYLVFVAVSDRNIVILSLGEACSTLSTPTRG